jgi:hypothetical protein
MKHNNPYEWAIFDRDIAKHLGCSGDDIDEIEKERKLFGEYCRECAKGGIFFDDQIEAWETYEERHPPASPKMVLIIEKEPPLTYETEMKRYFEQSAQFGNYTDTLGQQ